MTLRDIFVILGIDFTIEYGVVNVYRVPFHPDTFSIFGDELFFKILSRCLIIDTFLMNFIFERIPIELDGNLNKI